MAAARRVAAALVHRVNNALNPILAAAFLVERRADDPAAVREYAARIVRAAEACAADLAQLGPFLRAEPADPGRGAATDLAAVAAAVLAEAEGAWAAAGRPPVAVVADLAPGATVRGAPADLRAAVTHLVANAADAMPAGGRLTVAVGVDSDADDGGTVWLEVRDTGPGVDAAVAGRLFEPYASTKPDGRAGLGLAAVDGVARRHGGHVTLGPAPGGGTAVRLVLPRGAPAARPVP